jgi:hypothetical protein
VEVFYVNGLKNKIRKGMRRLKNTKKLARVAALLTVLCMISMVMIGGTFAKYTSEYSGQDTALVARWSFTGHFDDANLSGTNMDLPIWDHVYKTNIYEYSVADSAYLIAPGISGDFSVDIQYDADVDATLIFNFTKSGAGSGKVPLQYSLDSTFSTVYYSLDDLEDAIIATATGGSGQPVTLEGSDGTYTVRSTQTSGAVSIDQTVYWRWPYDTAAHSAYADKILAASISGPADGVWADVYDTLAASGALSRDSYVLNLQIKATQLTPAP